MAQTDNVHIAGVKAMYMADITAGVPLAVDAFASTHQIKSPVENTFTMNPTGVAFFQHFRENEAFPAFAIKDPKSGRIESLQWNVLDWDDDTLENLVGKGAGSTTDHWKSSKASFTGRKTLRIDFVTGWTLYFPLFVYAGVASGSASEGVDINVLGKVGLLGSHKPWSRVETPALTDATGG